MWCFDCWAPTAVSVALQHLPFSVITNTFWNFLLAGLVTFCWRICSRQNWNVCAGGFGIFCLQILILKSCHNSWGADKMHAPLFTSCSLKSIMDVPPTLVCLSFNSSCLHHTGLCLGSGASHSSLSLYVEPCPVFTSTGRFL